jgi:hypothetical protein
MYASAGSIDPWVKNLAPIARVFVRSLAVLSNRTGADTDALAVLVEEFRADCYRLVNSTAVNCL